MLSLSENCVIFTYAQDVFPNKSMAQFCSRRANHLYKVSVHIRLYFDVLGKKKKSTLQQEWPSKFYYFSSMSFFQSS